MIQPAKKLLRPTPPQVDPNAELARQQKIARRTQQLMMLATIGQLVQNQQQEASGMAVPPTPPRLPGEGGAGAGMSLPLTSSLPAPSGHFNGQQ